MPKGLAEADAGIDGDQVARNAGRFALGDTLSQHVEDIERHILVNRAVLHRLGIALGMHQDHRALELRCGCRTGGVISEG